MSDHQPIINEAAFLRMFAPAWWDLPGRYRKWKLMRLLRNADKAVVYHVPPTTEPEPGAST